MATPSNSPALRHVPKLQWPKATRLARPSTHRGFLSGKTQGCQKNLAFLLPTPGLPFSEPLLSKAYACESFLRPFEMHTYLLKPRAVFLKDLQAIPLNCNLHEGGPLSPSPGGEGKSDLIKASWPSTPMAQLQGH